MDSERPLQLCLLGLERLLHEFSVFTADEALLLRVDLLPVQRRELHRLLDGLSGLESDWLLWQLRLHPAAETDLLCEDLRLLLLIFSLCPMRSSNSGFSRKLFHMKVKRSHQI